MSGGREGEVHEALRNELGGREMVMREATGEKVRGGRFD